MWNILLKTNYLTNKRGVTSELVYLLARQNNIVKFP